MGKEAIIERAVWVMLTIQELDMVSPTMSFIPCYPLPTSDDRTQLSSVRLVPALQS